MRNTEQDAGMYTIDHQCTQVAIENARAAGLDIPSGLGKLYNPWVPIVVEAATPYHLDKELKAKGLVPDQVMGERFQNYLPMNTPRVVPNPLNR